MKKNITINSSKLPGTNVSLLDNQEQHLPKIPVVDSNLLADWGSTRHERKLVTDSICLSKRILSCARIYCSHLTGTVSVFLVVIYLEFSTTEKVVKTMLQVENFLEKVAVQRSQAMS